MSKVEVQVIYPFLWNGNMPVSWDSTLEAAIEAAIGEDVRYSGTWESGKHGWELSLNINPDRVPYIKHAIKSAFGGAVKVRA